MAASSVEAIREIVVLVGYKGQDIIDRFGDAYRGVPLRYAFQQEPRGLVHAIECAADALAGEDFMLMLGDEFMHNPRHREFVSSFLSSGVFAVCGVVSVLDPRLISKTYTIFEDNSHRIWRLIEKPRHPVSTLMGTGNCIFRNAILDYLPHTPINQQRMEKELPDLIQCAIDDGHPVTSFLICDEYVNVNDRDELDRTRSLFEHL